MNLEQKKRNNDFNNRLIIVRELNTIYKINFYYFKNAPLKLKCDSFAGSFHLPETDSLLACGCERIPAWHVWKLRQVLTWSRRGQCFPPFFSEISITRLRLWVPLPHPLSHRLHGLHSLTAQSTTVRIGWAWLKMWPSNRLSRTNDKMASKPRSINR